MAGRASFWLPAAGATRPLTREALEQRQAGTLHVALKVVLCEHAQTMAPGRDQLDNHGRFGRECIEQLCFELIEHFQRLGSARQPLPQLLE